LINKYKLEQALETTGTYALLYWHGQFHPMDHHRSVVLLPVGILLAAVGPLLQTAPVFLLWGVHHLADSTVCGVQQVVELQWPVDHDASEE